MVDIHVQVEMYGGRGIHYLGQVRSGAYIRGGSAACCLKDLLQTNRKLYQKREQTVLTESVGKRLFFKIWKF